MTKPAMLTTWWLWLAFAAAAAGVAWSDRWVTWREKPAGPGRKELALFGVMLVGCVASLVLGATFPWGGSVLWPLGAFAALGAALRLRRVATRELGQYFSGDLRTFGQRVVASGPYAVVRHPGYLAVWLCLVALVAAFALWPLLVAVAALMWWFLVKRIRVEEALNLAGVDGYAEYMQRVRWRLIPWVW